MSDVRAAREALVRRMVSAERQLRELSRGAVREHLICSLLFLRIRSDAFWFSAVP